MYSYNKYIFIVFAVFVIFFDEFFSAYMILANTGVISGEKQGWVMVTAGISFVFFVIDVFQNKVNKYMWRAILFVAFLCFCYFITGVVYKEQSPLFDTYFYVLIGQVLPATYIGSKLGTISNLHRVDYILPYIVISLTLIIGLYGWDVAQEGEIVNLMEAGISYQTMSYFAAYFYAYSAYYVFFSPLSVKPKHKLIRIMMLINMIFSAFLCLVSGGRGAFVFIVFITVFFVFIYFKNTKHKHFIAYILFLLLAVFFVWLSLYMNIWQTAGWGRVEERLIEDDNRTVLYKKAIEVFLSSPLFGKGLGSVWFTVGYYSHNIILDILVESGILGITVFIYLLIQISRRYYVLYLNDKAILFMFLVFLAPLIQAVFSGYYLALFRLFIASSFAYCYYSIYVDDLKAKPKSMLFTNKVN